MNEKLKARSFLVFFWIAMVAGGLCLPVFLIWPLFFDGQWIGFFISLVVLLLAVYIAERINESFTPLILKQSLLMIDFPHGYIGWMWFVTLGNAFFHFGKALFYEGSWWVWLGSSALAGFVKAALRRAIAQDDRDREEFLQSVFDNILQLAEQGNLDAQGDLGIMYYTGLGIPQNYQEAAKWFRLSAEQGEKIAQLNLGNMYDQGLGVPQDVVLAHMWVTLAAAQEAEGAMQARIKFEESMTKEQLSEAQRLAREWLAQHQK